METFIRASELDMFGDSNDPFFSLSQFDLELQQQAQAAIQQQHSQDPQTQLQQQQQQQQRPVQNLWQDFDRYLPIDCQSFMMNEPLTNAPNTTLIDGTSPFITTTTSLTPPVYEQPSTKKHDADLSPPYDFDITPIVRSQWATEDLIKKEYPSPEQYSYAVSPLPQSSLLVPSMAAISQANNDSNTVDNNNSSINTVQPSVSAASTPIPASQPPLAPSPPKQQQQQQQQLASPSPTISSNVADIIARMNWDTPTLSQIDPSK